MKANTLEARWATWAQRLRRWGVAPLVGLVLEAGEPIWALGMPLVEPWRDARPAGRAEAFLLLLLDEDARHRFMHWLWEGEA